MFTGAHDKLVDKRMFTTLLAQLKAAVSCSDVAKFGHGRALAFPTFADRYSYSNRTVKYS